MQYKTKQLQTLSEIREVLFMTYPIFKTAVLENSENFVVIATYLNKVAIGLLIILTKGIETLEISSIYVDKKYRKTGLAKKMLKYAIEILKDKQFKTLRIVYMSKKEYTLALENILNSFNFNPSISRQSIVQLSIELANKNKKLTSKLTGIPHSFEIKAWKDVTNNEIKILDANNLGDGKWIPPQLHPLKSLTNYTKDYSKAIYKDGELIGWIIMHMITTDIIRFTSAYVKPEFQYLNFVARVYTMIKDELLSKGIKYISWTTPMVYKPMVKFNQKWMSKYAKYEGVSYERNLPLK